MKAKADVRTIDCSVCSRRVSVRCSKADVAPELTIIETAEKQGWKVVTGNMTLSAFVVRAYCPECKVAKQGISRKQANGESQ